MSLNLKKLLGRGRGSVAAEPDDGAGPGRALRRPGELADGDTVSLYWKAGAGDDDTGWFQTQHDAAGAVVVPEGRVGNHGESRKDEPEIPQALFLDHFGFALSWERPDPAATRYVGRRPG